MWTHSQPYVLLHAHLNGSPFNGQGKYDKNPGTGSAPRLLRTLGRSNLEGFLSQKGQLSLEGQTAGAGIEAPTGEIAEITLRRKLGRADYKPGKPDRGVGAARACLLQPHAKQQAPGITESETRLQGWSLLT